MILNKVDWNVRNETPGGKSASKGDPAGLRREGSRIARGNRVPGVEFNFLKL
ncbi:hypothetical protein [Peribacillus frigoritolerans]|uniref:hypothetical protein n=1 Tax=Peribacillus frigoritolerans TaxID=450367 RepID=UPI0013A5CF70|nr:hypothetical protein [Peribacillus frigoritolerans]